MPTIEGGTLAGFSVPAYARQPSTVHLGHRSPWSSLTAGAARQLQGWLASVISPTAVDVDVDARGGSTFSVTCPDCSCRMRLDATGGVRRG